jgi:hypothetical protein
VHGDGSAATVIMGLPGFVLLAASDWTATRITRLETAAAGARETRARNESNVVQHQVASTGDVPTRDHPHLSSVIYRLRYFANWGAPCDISPIGEASSTTCLSQLGT